MPLTEANLAHPHRQAALCAKLNRAGVVFRFGVWQAPAHSDPEADHAAALAARKHQLEREAAALSARLNNAKNPPHPSHAKQIRRELRRVQNALVWYGVQPDEAA